MFLITFVLILLWFFCVWNVIFKIYSLILMSLFLFSCTEFCLYFSCTFTFIRFFHTDYFTRSFLVFYLRNFADEKLESFEFLIRIEFSLENFFFCLLVWFAWLLFRECAIFVTYFCSMFYLYVVWRHQMWVFFFSCVGAFLL